MVCSSKEKTFFKNEGLIRVLFLIYLLFLVWAVLWKFIISKETFRAVQLEKQHRSNITKGDYGTKRKSNKFSSKK